MNVNNEAIDVMVKAINNLIKTMIDKSHFDKTVKGIVVSHLGGKYYEVQLGNQIYKALSPTLICNKNDIVYIKIAENNYNNLIIECLVK